MYACYKCDREPCEECAGKNEELRKELETKLQESITNEDK